MSRLKLNKVGRLSNKFKNLGVETTGNSLLRYERVNNYYYNSNLNRIYNSLSSKDLTREDSVVINNINYLGLYYNLLKSRPIEYNLYVEYNDTLTLIHGVDKLQLPMSSMEVQKLESISIENIIIQSAIQSLSTLIDCKLPLLSKSIPSTLLLKQLVEESSEIFHAYYQQRNQQFPSKLLSSCLLSSINHRLQNPNIFTNKHAHNHLDLQIKQNRYPDINFLNGFISDIASDLEIQSPINKLYYNLIKSKYLLNCFV